MTLIAVVGSQKPGFISDKGCVGLVANSLQYFTGVQQSGSSDTDDSFVLAFPLGAAAAGNFTPGGGRRRAKEKAGGTSAESERPF